MSVKIDVCSLAGHMCQVVIESHLTVLHLKKAVEESTGMSDHSQMLYAGTYPLCNWDKVACVDHNGITCIRRDAEVARWLDHADKEPSREMLGVSREVFLGSPPAARADFEVMLTMARRNVQSLGLACPKLLANTDFMLRATQVNANATQWAADTLRGSRSFILAALRWDRHALQKASPELRADREFVREASLRDRWALGDAAEELLADQDFNDSVLANIRRQYIKESVRSDGRGLRRASDLRGDREVVLEAVQSDPNALEWASPELRNDELLVLAAQGDHSNHEHRVRINANSRPDASYGRLVVA